MGPTLTCRDVFSSGVVLLNKGDRQEGSPKYTAGGFASYHFRQAHLLGN
jgi:hypothetical protein